MENEIRRLKDKIAKLEQEVTLQRKYGLVWDKEKNTENVVSECITKIPILEQNISKNITNGVINNIIIEGDNYHSLLCLNFILNESIDLIYIDPPYNMGKYEDEDFSYNDKFVDEDDGYRHSKWLNFMEKRLKLARNLLSKDGIIFISIDENELANLTLLCNNIFGEKNYISSVFVLDNLKGKANDNFITSVGSRLLIYAKNHEISNKFGFNKIENVFGQRIEDTFNKIDNEGYYKLITYKKTGQSKYRKDRPYMFYPILEKDGILYAIEQNEFQELYDKKTKTFDDKFLGNLKKKYINYNFILPTNEEGEYLRWTSGYDTFIKKVNQDIIYDGGNVKQKDRPDANEMLQYYVSGTPKSFMYKPSYANGTEDLKKVLPESTFPFPKSVELMKDIIRLYPKKKFTILDFFGGSGTTAQAVEEVNKEDSGHRKFILCTNNENNICVDVMYPRIKTVLTGVRPNGSKYSNGTLSNLLYFKTKFIGDRKCRSQAKYDLVEKVDSLLCILEDCFDEVDRNKYSSHYVSIDKSKHLFIYNEHYNEKWFSELKSRVEKAEGQKIVYIYTSSNDLGDITAENKDRTIILKPIPSKIYEIYKDISNSLKKGD